MPTAQHVTTAKSPRLRAADLLIAAALAEAALQLISALWPADVSDDRASYPFTPHTQVVFEIAFAVLHVGILIGLVSLARSGAAGTSRVGRIGLWLVVLAYVILPFAELYEASVANLAIDDPKTEALAAFFGPATILYAVGGILGGTTIMRAGRWKGPVRLSLLVSSLVIVGLVIPSQFGTNRVITDFALTIWSLTVAWVGFGLRHNDDLASEVGAPMTAPWGES